MPCPEVKHIRADSKCAMNRSARTKDDYEFSTAKDPLFNSNRICKVEEHGRQEHRCVCVRTIVT